LNYLARREHSELELQRKLLSKGYASPAITTCLAALVDEGLVSNTRFTECYIHARRQKGYGPMRIHVELAARGIPQDLIEHQLDIADNAWFAHAQKAWRKHFKGIMPSDPKIRARQIRFLYQRGFTAEQIDTIFRSDHENA
jgi:regulatory protein